MRGSSAVCERLSGALLLTENAMPSSRYMIRMHEDGTADVLLHYYSEEVCLHMAGGCTRDGVIWAEGS